MKILCCSLALFLEGVYDPLDLRGCICHRIKYKLIFELF